MEDIKDEHSASASSMSIKAICGSKNPFTVKLDNMLRNFILLVLNSKILN